MKDTMFKFGFALRFRNKREITSTHEIAVRKAGVVDASFSQSEVGVFVAMFERESASQETAVRTAADELFQAVPDAILFEIIPSRIDRMAVRRAMMGFPMPWRFLDQGLPELASGGLNGPGGSRLSA